MTLLGTAQLLKFWTERRHCHRHSLFHIYLHRSLSLYHCNPENLSLPTMISSKGNLKPETMNYPELVIHPIPNRWCCIFLENLQYPVVSPEVSGHKFPSQRFVQSLVYISNTTIHLGARFIINSRRHKSTSLDF